MTRPLFITLAALVVAFVAGGKDMIAGKYAVEVPPGGGPVVLTSASGISGLMPVVTEEVAAGRPGGPRVKGMKIPRAWK